MKYVVITGTSTGIGRACTINLAQHGFHVFGSVRRKEDAVPLKEILGNSFTELLFDVTDHNSICQAVELVTRRVGKEGLNALVNNAGIAIDGPLMHIPIDLVRKQFEINVFGALRVTQAFLPLLGARKESPFAPGRIVNISSVAGRVAFPFMGAYSASKHALEAMSDALRRELVIYGIDVILIEPGSVRTSIFEKAAPISAYKDTDYGPSHQSTLDGIADTLTHARPVEDVSDAVRTALTINNPKTRYVLASRLLKWLIMSRFMPDRWVDKKLALSRDA